MKTASNQLLVIFGASGDLTGRKLLPSLYELHVRRLLPERFCILGAARTEYSDDEYRAFEKVHIRESLKRKRWTKPNWTVSSAVSFTLRSIRPIPPNTIN